MLPVLKVGWKGDTSNAMEMDGGCGLFNTEMVLVDGIAAHLILIASSVSTQGG